MRLSGILKVAIMASLSVALMRLQIPMFAPWLKYDPSECPALIVSFALGPVYGLLVVLLKNFVFGLTNFQPIELVGVPLNTLAGGVWVLVSGNIYQLKKTKKMAIVSLALGVLAMTIVMVPANILLYPLVYKLFMHTDIPLTTAAVVNIAVLSSTPFNLTKGVLTSALTFVVYKRVSAFLKADSVHATT